MKLLTSALLFLLISSPIEACHIIAPLYSLAGPSTVILKELNLLKDKNLKGISTFNPIASADYSGERLGGGLFLSRQEEKTFHQAEVLFDQGRELDRYFSKRSYPSTKIATMGKTPLQVVESVLDILGPKLSGCESQIKEIIAKSKLLAASSFKDKKKIIFFLGEISQDKKYPGLVIGKDGFVKAWSDQGKIETYPSELNYIHWSQKIIRGFAPDFIFVGISEPKDQKKIEFKKINETHFNLIYPGALTPGYSQLEVMSFLAGKL